MEQIMFSIAVVCLNAGNKLKMTIESILAQTYENYEIIVKDGISTDGSLDNLPCDERIKIYTEADKGIYDAMNQAMEKAKGEYIYFLNCGDFFYEKGILEKVNVSMQIMAARSGMDYKKHIYYGDIYERLTKERVSSNPNIDAFACYRNVPCHQACFYGVQLMRDKKFDLRYKVRADYEQFLWCFFRGKAQMHYMPFIIADYEGGGFSEAKKNKKRSEEEHEEIVNKYMSKTMVRKFRLIMLLTFSTVRTWLAGNKVTARAYNRIKKRMYKKHKG